MGPWTDLYSVGVIAYELLVGSVPFSAGTHAELLLRHARQPVPPPRAVRPDLPAELERWLLRLLAKDPRERFGDAAATRTELHAIVARSGGAPWRSAAPPACAGHPTERLNRPRRRRAVAAADLARGRRRRRGDARTLRPGRRARARGIDARFAVRGTQPARNVMVVAIDQQSLDTLGATRWPPPRSLHARAIDALRRDGASVIAYRVSFTKHSIPEEDDRLIGRSSARRSMAPT